MASLGQWGGLVNKWLVSITVQVKETGQEKLPMGLKTI